jgi:hypothetical protein
MLLEKTKKRCRIEFTHPSHFTPVLFWRKQAYPSQSLGTGLIRSSVNIVIGIGSIYKKHLLIVNVLSAKFHELVFLGHWDTDRPCMESDIVLVIVKELEAAWPVRVSPTRIKQLPKNKLLSQQSMYYYVIGCRKTRVGVSYERALEQLWTGKRCKSIGRRFPVSITLSFIPCLNWLAAVIQLHHTSDGDLALAAWCDDDSNDNLEHLVLLGLEASLLCRILKKENYNRAHLYPA